MGWKSWISLIEGEWTISVLCTLMFLYEKNATTFISFWKGSYDSQTEWELMLNISVVWIVQCLYGYDSSKMLHNDKEKKKPHHTFPLQQIEKYVLDTQKTWAWLMSLSFQQTLCPIPDDSNTWVLRAAHVAWVLVITVIGWRGQSTDWQAWCGQGLVQFLSTYTCPSDMLKSIPWAFRVAGRLAYAATSPLIVCGAIVSWETWDISSLSSYYIVLTNVMMSFYIF